MQKTKLGVSVALMGAALYFLGLFSGYVALIILAGYVLLMEENVWLKIRGASFAVFTDFIRFGADSQPCQFH